MRTKEGLSIPSTSPALNSASNHAGAQRTAYNKHINLNQPKFITKSTNQSRYGQSGGGASSAHNHGGAGNSLSQGRGATGGYVAAAITPTNRVSDTSQEHCFRIVSQGGLASTKNGTQASLLATSQAQAAVSHRSASRDGAHVGAGHPGHSYSRKSTIAKNNAGTHSSQAHQTPLNTNSMTSNRVAQKVKASQLSASSLQAHTMKMAQYQAPTYGQSQAHKNHHHNTSALNKENRPNHGARSGAGAGHSQHHQHGSVKTPFGGGQSHAFHALNKSAYIQNTNKSVLEGRRATSTGTGKAAMAPNSHNVRTGAASVGAAQASGLGSSVASKQQTQTSIREPNKSASSTGVGMYNKDYSSSQARSTPHNTQQSSQIRPTATVDNSGSATPMQQAHGKASNAQGTTLNKSLENVIRKAAYKGIEPLRRRYTGGASSSLTTSSYTQAARKHATTSSTSQEGGGKTTASRKSTHDSNLQHHHHGSNTSKLVTSKASSSIHQNTSINEQREARSSHIQPNSALRQETKRSSNSVQGMCTTAMTTKNHSASFSFNTRTSFAANSTNAPAPKSGRNTAKGSTTSNSGQQNQMMSQSQLPAQVAAARQSTNASNTALRASARNHVTLDHPPSKPSQEQSQPQSEPLSLMNTESNMPNKPSSSEIPPVLRSQVDTQSSFQQIPVEKTVASVKEYSDGDKRANQLTQSGRAHPGHSTQRSRTTDSHLNSGDPSQKLGIASRAAIASNDFKGSEKPQQTTQQQQQNSSLTSKVNIGAASQIQQAISNVGNIASSNSTSLLSAAFRNSSNLRSANTTKINNQTGTSAATTTVSSQKQRERNTTGEKKLQSVGKEQPMFSLARLQEVANLAEQRRRDRNKSLTRQLEVCDLLDLRKVQSLAEHAPTITRFLRNDEKNFLLPENFMGSQMAEVTEKMRAYLVDWLAELHFKFKMWQETLHVTVGIIDRFLAMTPDLKKTELQCLGITALHIAGKYEEIYPPELKNLLRVTDNAVAKHEIIKMEYRILNKLQFSVTFPSSYRFLERFCRLAQAHEKHFILAQYFVDTSLLDCRLQKENPSRVAAVSLYLALALFKPEESQQAGARPGQLWSPTLMKNTGYREDDINQMSKDLLQFVKKIEKSQLKTFFKKFSDQRFAQVASLLESVEV